MRLGLLGKKVGMMQVFTDEGRYVPVTVLEAGPCTVLRKASSRLLLGFGDKKEKNTPKAQLSIYKKLNKVPKAFVKEVDFDSNEKIEIGQDITVGIFKEKDYVDVTGTSIGKGFQGVVKRHHFKGGPGGHGSMFHRAPGGIGSMAGGVGCRKGVRKGKRFPGRMGGGRKTVQSLEVVKIVSDKNIILVKGPVPGAKNSFLEINLAKKRKSKAIEEKKA